MIKFKKQKKNFKTIVHIGLHKTGTTSLQKHFFPQICNDKTFLYNPKAFYQVRKDIVNLKKTNIKKKKKFKSFLNSKKIFISSENLIGWHPENWSKFADKILEYFGKRAKIVITIRDSAQLLTSLYLHAIKEKKIIDPKNFFFSDKPKKKQKKFFKDLRNRYPYESKFLNYDTLKEIYTKRFNDVYFLPTSKFLSLYPWDILFELNKTEKKKFKEILKKSPRENIGLNKNTVKFIFFLKKIKILSEKSSLFQLNPHNFRRFVERVLNPSLSSKKFSLKKNIMKIDKDLIKKNKKFIKNQETIINKHVRHSR